jgi:Legume lectin domain
MLRMVAICGLLFACATAEVSAGTIVYSDFATTNGLTVNGDSASVLSSTRTVMRLTPSAFFKSGSIFATAPVVFGADYGFSTRFTFNINTTKGGGADGIVFVIQPNANNVGGSGGGIGYKGISNSLGVEYDDYNNGLVDEGSDNHIGIDTNGNLDSLVQNSALAFRLDSGRDLTSWIDYDGASQTLEVRLNNSAIRPLSALLSYRIDLPALIGRPQAFVGFTSGTGGSAANHDLINWEFRDRFDPVDANAVPETSTWITLIAGFGFMGTAMRHRRRAVAMPFSSR